MALFDKKRINETVLQCKYRIARFNKKNVCLSYIVLLHVLSIVLIILFCDFLDNANIKCIGFVFPHMAVHL